MARIQCELQQLRICLPGCLWLEAHLCVHRFPLLHSAGQHEHASCRAGLRLPTMAVDISNMLKPPKPSWGASTSYPFRALEVFPPAALHRYDEI
eukprot:3680280-Amphidinium_carterae.1